jgi:hypothetical protein
MKVAHLSLVSNFFSLLRIRSPELWIRESEICDKIVKIRIFLSDTGTDISHGSGFRF